MPKGSNGESRSGLTPITGETTTSLDTTRPGTTEEWTQGFQSFWFEGYTTQEVCRDYQLVYQPQTIAYASKMKSRPSSANISTIVDQFGRILSRSRCPRTRPPKKRYPSVGAMLLPKVPRFELTIHSLLHRDKWTQEPLPPQQRNNWKGKYNNFELRYNLRGSESKYDVKVRPRNIVPGFRQCF